VVTGDGTHRRRDRHITASPSRALREPATRSEGVAAERRGATARRRRETIAFGRRLNAVLERLFLAAVWRNFVKRRSERLPRSGTPAMRLGLAHDRWDWRRVLSRRIFPARTPTPPTWALLYRRMWTTPLYPRNSRHDLNRAF
jgi:hypothetical protein